VLTYANPVPTGPGKPAQMSAAALAALTQIQWMACRQATDGGEEGIIARVAAATWALAVTLDEQGCQPLQPTRTARTAAGSVYPIGVPAGYRPRDQIAVMLLDSDPTVRLQRLIDLLHPLARRYADGRASAAASTCNDATRTLLTTGFDLSATEVGAGTVWARDAHGPAYDGLSPQQRATVRPARQH